MRIGIVGTRWGRMHIGGFRGAGAEIAAICGRDAARTREVAAAEGIPRHDTDVAVLCRAVDLVVVASPDALHHEHVRAAIDAGCHVLCEKPLTRDAEDAEALVRRGATSERVLAVSFPYRMLPPLQALATWLRARGPARAATVTVRNGFLARTHAGDDPRGASGDFGGLSHVVDAALWLLGGRARAVQATLVGRPIHDALLQLRLDHGAIVDLAHVASPVPGIAGAWQLVGDDWAARFEGGYAPALGGWRIGPVLVASRAGDWQELAPRVEPVPGRREPWAEAHVATARAMLRAIAGGDRGELATLEDGAHVQQIFAAALRSETEGRRVEIA